MNVIEYLMSELSLSEEKASEVASTMKELAHQHHDHKRGEEKEDASEMIMESKEEIETVRNAITGLHCNGCEKHCSLLTPGCGRGRKAAELLIR